MEKCAMVRLLQGRTHETLRIRLMGTGILRSWCVYVLGYRIGLWNGKRKPGSRFPAFGARARYSGSVPELPEVETVASGLNGRVAGDTIKSVWIGERLQPLKSPAAMIVSTLEGKRIARVHRAGKHIIIDLEDRGEAAEKKAGRRATKRRSASQQDGNTT